ncbi:right-handed parallel beta-helix repeat-containing protein [Paenibacillus sp. HJGM_3]|uniref:right-handed parallel beta-helix repeat-containing protein n=1 Tax=Paenibacillus sp. HJGM_3 TaxID=3379816 RepID=UPI003859AEC3
MPKHDQEHQEQSTNPISRRKLLASLGATSVALAAGASLFRAPFDAVAKSVTEGVYGPNDHPVFSTKTSSVNNVRDYGAVGDGTTDDTAAIQSALNQALQASGTHVHIPPGTYKVTDTLRIYRHTRLTLDPDAKILRCHDYSFLVNGDNGPGFPGYEGHGDLWIEGGVWEGNILLYPDTYNGFGLARGRNIVIRNIEMRDVVSAHGVDMNACENVVIENCRFLGYRDSTPDQSRDYAEAIQLANHTQEGFSQMGAFDGTPCRNVTVRNCYFGASGTPGTQAWPSGVGNHYAVYDLYNSNIKIVDNTFEGMTFAGVRSFKFAELFISNNLFLNCNRGVMLSNPAGDTNSSKDAAGNQTGLPQSSKNIVITGNIFKGTKSETIYCVGWPKTAIIHAKVESVIIADNVFDHGLSSKNCITLRWVHHVTITGNTFRNQYRGIWLSYVTKATISQNVFQDMIVEAIYSEEPDADYKNRGLTADIQVLHNQIDRCGRTGIYIQSMESFQVIGNIIHSPATETHNTRSGILVANSAKKGKVASNRITKALTGNQNQYGVSVTGTCSDVQVADNIAEGVTAAVSVQGSTNFDGIYLHSPNGTRYKMTIGNDGAILHSPA